MGLIGSSLGMALRKAKIGVHVVGYDRDRGAANRAQRAGASDSTETNPITAVKGARLVVLAIPIGAMPEVMQLIGPELDDGCVVTDTGSTKAAVLRWAEEHLPSSVSFVGGHPMAGKELSGPEAAEVGLFQGATYCVIPGKGAGEDAVKSVVNVVEAVGAKAYFIDAEEHDSYVAAISHLPLVLSAVLVNIASASPSWPEIARLASSGFRDTTRLASGIPQMSRDICVTNPDGVVYWIDEFIKELYAFRGLVQDGAEKPLEKTFDDAWEARDRWLQKKVTAPSANPPVAIPSTAEAMSGLVLGDRAASRVREMMDWNKEDKRKKGL